MVALVIQLGNFQESGQQERQDNLRHRVWYAQFLCLASPLIGGPIAPERLLAIVSPRSRQVIDDDEIQDRPQDSRPGPTFAVAVGACGGLAAWRLAATAPFASAVPMHKLNGKQVASQHHVHSSHRMHLCCILLLLGFCCPDFQCCRDWSPCSSTWGHY